MKEFRCKKCGRLLGRYRECQELEIKCPRCKSLNKVLNPPLSPFSLSVEKPDLLGVLSLPGK